MGKYTAHLVGESKYQSAVGRLRLGDPVALVPEPDNPHDPRAIQAVGPGGDTVGYIERDSWITRTMLDEKGTVAASVAEIIGGGRGQSKGVVLQVLTAGDAAAKPAAPPARTMSTAMKLGWVAVGAVLLLAFCTGDDEDPIAEAPSLAPAAQRLIDEPPASLAPGMPTIDDAAARELTLARCTANYPDDLALRAACARNAADGIASFREIAGRHAGNPDMQRALRGCLDRYPDDFALVGGCARNNEDGLESLVR